MRTKSGLLVEVAEDLRRLVESSPGAFPIIAPEANARISAFIASALSSHFREWKYEGVDGIRLAGVMGLGEAQVRLSGVAIRVGDQVVMPFLVDFELASLDGGIGRAAVRIGKRAGSAVVKGPQFGSAGAARELDAMRLPYQDHVEWAFEVDVVESELEE